MLLMSDNGWKVALTLDQGTFRPAWRFVLIDGCVLDMASISERFSRQLFRVHYNNFRFLDLT